jgi:uncharacterized DUF497 family protein
MDAGVGTMDLRFESNGLHFCWNAEKAASNFAKHGVSFEHACEVFFDPFIRLIDATTGDESRDAALGATLDRMLLFVVHLIREDEAIRIISARPATRGERRLYEDNGGSN